MKDQEKTREELIDELKNLRSEISELRESEAKFREMEGLLRESEERFRSLYENAPLAYQSLDANGCFLEVNQAWSDMLGYDRDEVIGAWCGDYLTPSYRDKFTVYFPQFKAIGRIHGVEFEMVRKDGTTVFVTANGRIGRNEQGRFKQTHCILNDITEQRLAEAAKELSERVYRQMFEGSRAVKLIIDPESGYLIDANPAAEHFYGYVLENLKRLKISDINTLSIEQIFGEISKVMDGQRQEFIFKHRLASGEIRDVEVHSSPLDLGDKRLLYSIIHDITERKLMEQALTVREQQYRTLVENIPSLIVRYDRELRRIYVNPAWEKVSGLTAKDVVNVRAADIAKVPSPINVRYTEKILRVLETGTPEQIEFSWVNARGTTLFLEYVLTPEYDRSGEIVSILAVGHDLTERKRAEEELNRANQEWERTFNGISDLIMVLDDQHRIIRANKSTVEAFGMAEDELLGKHCFEIIHRENWPPVFCPHSKLLADGKEHSAEFTEPRLGRTYDARVSPLVDRDLRVIGSVHVIRDITRRKNAEESLRKSEQRLELALHGADLGLWDWYIQTNQAVANERAAEIVGYRLDEIEQTFAFWKDLIHPDDLQGALQEITNYLVEGAGYYENEYRARHKSGHWKWILARGKVTERDSDGNAVRATGTFLDITDKKLAESQASEANELREKIVSESPMGIAVFRADGQCVSANPELARIVGADQERILIQNFRSLSSWRDSGLLGDAEYVLSGGLNQQREVHLTSTFGKSVWVNARMARLTSGREPHLLIVLNDITERKIAEDALKFEREQLLSLFESLNDVIVVIDPQTYEILYANKFTQDLYGKDLRGGLCYEKLHGATVPCGSCHNEKIIKLQGKPYQWEYTNPVLGRDFLATDRMIRWPDGRDVKFQIALDITQRNRAEREQERLKAQLFQAQKMEAIGALAGGIAHDFNNLLQIVLGYSDMLIIGKGKESQDVPRLEAIRKAAKDGGELVKGLLTFSRQVDSNFRPTDLNIELRRIERILTRTIPKMIGIEMILADDLRPVKADPVQFEQIILNLSVNAQHAISHGGKLIFQTENLVLDEDYCKAHLEATPGEYVLLKVSDTGHGMEKDVLERIFEPFYTTKKLGEGTGLGLAIVYGIVKNHGGHILCKSKMGHGTTFYVYFPALPREAKPDMAVTLTEMPAFGTENILLADDDECVRNMLEQLLSECGYGVLTAENGAQALETYRARGSEIDLVILDSIMPEMGGEQCLEQILTIDPRAKILVESGDSGDASMKRALNLGAAAFIPKPFDAKKVLRTVRKLLDNAPESRKDGVESDCAQNNWVPDGLHTSRGPLAKVAQTQGPYEIEDSSQGMRILVIDDRLPFLKIIDIGLTRLGQTVLTASSGVEGLKVFQETSVDLVVCDLEMPGLDGWRVGAGIKEICREKGVPKTPFILLTGESNMVDVDAETEQNFTDYGVDAILAKPVDIPDLLLIAKRTLRKSQTNRQ
jgi:two-component system, cell cycle sensor histidine kinase and response regulator CckA